MKTTVEIDDDLLKAAKKAAIDEGVTLRELLEDALRHRLALHRSNVRVRTWGRPATRRARIFTRRIPGRCSMTSSRLPSAPRESGLRTDPYRARWSPELSSGSRGAPCRD